MRVVIDNNVFVSDIFWGGSPSRVIEMARAGLFQVVTSPDLLKELREALMGKFRVPEARYQGMETDILQHADIVVPEEHVEVAVRDPGDVKVIACAIAARADYIITGDRDLLVLREVQGVRIVTPREFLDLFSESW